MEPLILRFDVEDDGGDTLRNINVNLHLLISSLDKAKEKMGLFDRALLAFRSGLDAIRGVIFSVGSALAALGISLSAGALIHQIREAANELDLLGKASVRTGLAVEDLSKLKIAASLSNVDFGGLQDALKFLQVNAVATDAAFGQLGVTIRDTAGNIRPAKDLLLDVSDALVRVEDPAQRAALSIAIFGKAGTSLLPLVTSNIREAVEEAEKLGAVFTGDMTSSAEAFDDSISRLQISVSSLRNVLASEFFPTATNVFDNLAVLVANNRQQFVDWTREALPNLAQVTDAVVDVAQALAVMFAVAKDSFNGVLFVLAAFRTGLAAVEAGIKGVANEMTKFLAPIPSAIGPKFNEVSASFGASITGAILKITPERLANATGFDKLKSDMEDIAFKAHADYIKAITEDHGEARVSDSFQESLKELTARLQEMDAAVATLGTSSNTEKVLDSFEKIRAKVREVVSEITKPSPFQATPVVPNGPPIQVQDRELGLLREQSRLSSLQAQAKREEQLLSLQLQLGLKNELDAVKERYAIQQRVLSGQEAFLRTQLEQTQTAAERLKIEAELSELLKDREFLSAIQPLEVRNAELNGAGNFVDGLAASINDFTKAASPFALAQQGLTEGLNGFATAFSNATAAAINGTQSIASAFQNMAVQVLQQIQMIIIKMLVMAAIAAIFGIATGGVGTLASLAVGIPLGGASGGGGGGTSGAGDNSGNAPRAPVGGNIDSIVGRGAFAGSFARGGAGNRLAGPGGVPQPPVEVQVVNIRTDEDLNRWAESQQGRNKILKVTREDG